MATVIAIDDVTKTLKGVPVFERASASFERGRISAVVGSNGSGKSVLFQLICGFLRPDSGAIRIEREFLPPGNVHPIGFGILINGPGYLPFARGYENLQKLADIRGIATKDDIHDAMRAVGLDPHLRQRVRNYSLGMKQKLGLAQAIMEQQQVLLLDEPFNGLDRSSVDQIRALLLRLREEGRTIIFTSHIGGDIAAIADDIIEVNDRALHSVHDSSL